MLKRTVCNLERSGGRWSVYGDNDLGVLLEGQLTMIDHVAALSRSCFFQLLQLRSVKQSPPPEATMTLVHAFVNT